MEIAYYSLIGAVAALVLLAGLFRFEDKRGERIVIRKVRIAADNGLVCVADHFQRMLEYIGRGTVRQTSHFLLHRILKTLLGFVRRIEKALRRIQAKNRQAAHADLEQHVDERMNEVKNHANTIKLSSEEKRKQRMKLLE